MRVTNAQNSVTDAMYDALHFKMQKKTQKRKAVFNYILQMDTIKIL